MPAPHEPFHPDLKGARLLPPRTVLGARSVRLTRRVTGLLARWVDRAASEEAVAEGVSVRVHRPAAATGPGPALLWMHAGGLVIGDARMDEPFRRRVAGELGAVVASVQYRLAPEHPFPTPLEDCYAALRWLADRPDVDPARIAVGGASAGGGLAAALAILARDRGELRPAFQLLVYPMLDDRSSTRTDVDRRRLRLWDQRSNRYGWSAYLGGAAGDDVPPPAVPARCDDLRGLPPAWIGVGTHDLFHDEDLAYADRLRQAGVPCTVHVVPGAYHGFDTVHRGRPVCRAFEQEQVDALAGALGAGRPAGTPA